MFALARAVCFSPKQKDSRKVRDRPLPKTSRVYAALEFVPKRERIAGEDMVAIQPNSHANACGATASCSSVIWKDV